MTTEDRPSSQGGPRWLPPNATESTPPAQPPYGDIPPREFEPEPPKLKLNFVRPPEETPEEVAPQPIEVRGPVADLYQRVMAKDRKLVRDVHEIIIGGPGGTGKSTSLLSWIWWMVNEFPKCRVLIVRKTRVSLTESALKTLEQDVIPPDNPILKGAARAQRQHYVVPGGGEIICGGMDNPTRLYSTDWDIIYVQEATELTEDEWERLRRGLRNGKTPGQFLVGDCNPESQRHWIYRRGRDKKTELLESHHYDNPAWFDAEQNAWTAGGIAYLNSLMTMTGVRLRRLYKGEWCSADGAVWENFDRDAHVLFRPANPIVDLGIRYTVGAMDWGYTAPGTLLVFGVDSDNRMYLLSETYRVEQDMDWWAKRLIEEHKAWNLAYVVGDPARKDAIVTMNKWLSQNHMHHLVRPANNRRANQGGDLGGIDLVRKKLDKQADGKPALFFLRDSLREVDRVLADKRQPISTLEEIPEYVYAKVEDGQINKERTDPTAADHGCFVAGTLVETPNGRVPIETLLIGDFVTTPFGARRVLDSGMTCGDAEVWALELVDGTVLRGTGDHPIWTTDGWRRIDSLQYGATVATWEKSKRLNGVDLSGAGIQSLDTAQSGTTSAGRGGLAAASFDMNSCTGASTPTNTGLFRLECTSITETVILETTASGISNSSLQPSIARDIQKTSSSPENSPRLGTAASSDAPGIGSMRASSILDTSLLERGSAPGAGLCSSRGITAPSRARTHVGPLSAERLASMTKRAHVSSAEIRSASTAIASRDVVLCGVRRVVRVGRAAVYNVTVDVDHVYFAGGILSMNCDSIRYAACEVWGKDLSAPTQASKYGRFTFGAAMGHDKTWDDIRSGRTLNKQGR